MREIKFRGKTLSGKWVYGYAAKFAHDSVPVILEDTENGIAPRKIIPETVCQFTGLHDKNGREIYEGDIVCANHFFVSYDVYTPKPIRNAYNIEIDQKGLVTSVLYSRNYAIEFYPNKGWIMRNGSDQHRMHSIKGEANIEVIGNIHDNPELLKTE